MAPRIARLLCSNTFLLSILSILGILELAKNIFDNQEAIAEFNTNIDTVNNKLAHISTTKPAEVNTNTIKREVIPENITKRQVMMKTEAPVKEIITTKEVLTKRKKRKTYVRRKILLLAYARSGSSFTGELLSAGPKAAYYYEPLFGLRPNGTAIENVLMRDPSQSHLVEQHVQGVFKCSWPLLRKLNKLNFPTIRKRGMSCKSSTPRVIKTIRLRRAGLEPWIYKTDIKVNILIYTLLMCLSRLCTL